MKHPLCVYWSRQRSHTHQKLEKKLKARLHPAEVTFVPEGTFCLSFQDLYGTQSALETGTPPHTAPSKGHARNRRHGGGTLPRLGVEIYVKEGRSDEADVSDGPRLPVETLPLAFVISPLRL